MFRVELKSVELWLDTSDQVRNILDLVEVSDDNKLDPHNTGDDFRPVNVLIG